MVDNVHLGNVGSKALVLRSPATDALQHEDGFVDLASIIDSAARQAMVERAHHSYTTAILRFAAVAKRREEPVAIII